MENILANACTESLISQATTSIQQEALELTNCDPKSLDFKTNIQIAFLRKGANIKTALSAQYDLQTQALEAGANPETAMKFTTDLQIDCLNLGLDPENAVRCEQDDQYHCLASVDGNGKTDVAGCLPDVVEA
ncbi:MAG: hypothetical protein RLN62_04060 [Rickettsiales bacterium]